MSNKCLVTKLKGTVDNDSLLGLGEMIITVHRQNNPTNNTQSVKIRASNGSVTLTPKGGLIGTALDSLGDRPLSIQNKEETVYFENKDFSVVISNKYAITSFDGYGVIGFDINKLAYNDLTKISLSSPYITGKLSDLGRQSSLTYIGLTNTAVSGEVTDIGNLPSLSNFIISNTSIAGDVKYLPASLALLYLSGTFVSGDVKNLPKAISVCECSSYITGNIEEMKGFKNLRSISFPSGEVTGEINVLAQNLIDAGNTNKSIKLSFKTFTPTINGTPITRYTVYIHINESGYTIDYQQ